MSSQQPLNSRLSRSDFIHFYLNLSAYWLIPGFTIYFVQGSNWFTTNFSVLGSGLAKQNAFAFWGLLVGIYFFTILEIISKHLAFSLKETFFIPLALLLLTCAITTPYLPEQFPFKSFLHVIFAFLSAVCLAFFLILVIRKLHRARPGQFWPYSLGLALIIFLGLILLIAAGIVSSALEIFFTLSVTLFCRRLERKLQCFGKKPIDKTSAIC